MNATIDDIPAIELGERLRIAREHAGVTQADAAASIEAARTTVVAIEKGQRRVRLNELQSLCRRYGTSVNALLRKEAVQVDFEPQFRKLPQCKGESIEAAAKLLSQLARAEIELENLLGIKRTRNDPPETPVLSGDVRLQAEQDALELRQWLGIGSGPIPDLLNVLELTIGARVYVQKLDARISGVFAYHSMTGPCILLNANHPKTRRNQSGAHELAHFLSSRHSAEISRADMAENSREERYADAFARAFLTPVRAVMQKFREITAGSDKLTRRHVIILAHYFGVSREAIVRRLEELKLIKAGTWDWFCGEGGITDAQARQVLGDRLVAEDDYAGAEATALRLNLLAAEAYRQELMSEGQLARLLGLSRIELRGILDESERDRGEAHIGSILPE